MTNDESKKTKPVDGIPDDQRGPDGDSLNKVSVEMTHHEFVVVMGVMALGASMVALDQSAILKVYPLVKSQVAALGIARYNALMLDMHERGQAQWPNAKYREITAETDDETFGPDVPPAVDYRH